LMTRVLKGEPLGAADLALTFAVSVVVASVALYAVARQLRTAALRG